MKVGTKFKLECEINAYGQVVVDGDLIYDYDGDALGPELLRERAISDVRPPPRRRITDPVDGREYEILEDGDTWEAGDLAHSKYNGKRREAGEGNLIGRSVLTGYMYVVGLRPVKP